MDKVNTKTELHCADALTWLEAQALENAGVIPPFANQELRAAIGLDKQSSRHLGQIVSRLDFLCYCNDLPPIGLTADLPFKGAWNEKDSGWLFPVKEMAAAAQSHRWTSEDFSRLRKKSSTTELMGALAWQKALRENNDQVKQWAYSFTEVTAGNRQKNRVWSREELILALHLYLKFKPGIPAREAPEIYALSRTLNKLAELKTTRQISYRNPNGVYMKVMNFRSIDPDYTAQGKTGLRKNNRDEYIVWNLFADAPAKLNDTVAAILRYTKLEEPMRAGSDDEESEDEFMEAEEGAVLTAAHKSRERNRKIIREFKDYVKRRKGSLVCEACGFEAADKYGIEFADKMEVHHTRPVHTLQPGEKTNFGDLAILCANCHRVVHARKKWLTLDELRTVLRVST
jgi:predicted HNH restriction endonuclease